MRPSRWRGGYRSARFGHPRERGPRSWRKVRPRVAPGACRALHAPEGPDPGGGGPDSDQQSVPLWHERRRTLRRDAQRLARRGKAPTRRVCFCGLRRRRSGGVSHHRLDRGRFNLQRPPPRSRRRSTRSLGVCGDARGAGHADTVYQSVRGAPLCAWRTESDLVCEPAERGGGPAFASEDSSCPQKPSPLSRFRIL